MRRCVCGASTTSGLDLNNKILELESDPKMALVSVSSKIDRRKEREKPTISGRGGSPMDTL